ncbi:MAG TPA: hypothetical protein VMI09_06490 [Candidatus Binataceae bacterium]|nr:hypothetical protein [Candidatus Binataceae bacterium]
MKLKSQAMLLLCGWYLMYPPRTTYSIKSHSIGSLRNTSAPLSRWTMLGSFDTAVECDKALVANGGGQGSSRNEADLILQCIASDDPRLKEK